MRVAVFTDNDFGKINGVTTALTALLAGQVQVVCTSPLAALPFVRAGRLRGLAMTSLTRSHAAPDIPTVAESGLPGFEVNSWYGVFGPAALPANLRARINGDIVAIHAEIVVLDGLSAHADYPEILDWLGHFERAPRRTFVVHGEPDASRALRDALEAQLDWAAVVPKNLERVRLG